MTNRLLATPRALKAIKPEHLPSIRSAITYVGQETLGSADTGLLFKGDRRRVATSSHKNHVVLVVGSTAAVLSPLQAEQAAAALQMHAKRARAQRHKGTH